jgi:hypothetical protein
MIPPKIHISSIIKSRNVEMPDKEFKSLILKNDQLSQTGCKQINE